jgi:class 3 adenylate cyclase/tetratricopeptide (TPR) repeat protein
VGACWRCGEEASSQALFCSACGARLGIDLRSDARLPVTVLFNDVTDSTRLADRFDPETVRRVVSRYFAAVSSACERHGGVVEKFIGDAVMAVFGLGNVHEDHALRGVRAAGEIRESLERLNGELERDLGLTISTRTGLESGEVVAGDPAGGQALVTGDAVNVAARLEQAAPPGEILIGDATRRLTGEAVVAAAVEPLALKGKDEPVVAWRLDEVLSRAGQPPRRPAAPMLGRERELRVLEEAFARVVAERAPHRVTVLGAAGIGKSRLGDELRSELVDRATVLVGHSLPYGEGVTFSALAEVVRQAVGPEPSPAVRALLAGDTRAGLIADLVGAVVSVSDRGGERKDLPWAIRRLLEALARRRPLLVVLEDVHWAEPPLLDLIDYLTERITDAPVLLVCLAREELLEQRPEWGRKRESASTVSLEPLSREDTEQLVEVLLREQVPRNVRAEVAERASGNPLFAEQMTALVRETGGEQIAIPPTIQALLAARLDRLPREELRVIEVASVVGSDFWPAAVSALSRIDAASLDQALAGLARRRLVRPGAATPAGESGFSFQHALIRDTAYETLTKETRVSLHERFAGWLEERYGDRPAEVQAVVGHHLERAYRYRTELAPVDDQARSIAERAAGSLASAGRRAARAREDATALGLLSRAGSLLGADDRDRLALMPLIGQSFEGAANHARAGEVYEEALERALSECDRAVEGRARLGRARVWFVAEPDRSSNEIVEEAERAITLLEAVEDRPGLVEAWRLVGESRMYEGRAADGQRALERALGELRPDDPPRSLNAASFAMGFCLLEGPAPLERAVRFAAEQLELARARGMLSFEADMLHLLGAGEARRGRFETARQSLADSTAISEELGLAYMAQWSSRSLGRLELAAGDPVAAEKALRWSHGVLVEMGLKGSLGETAVPLAEALCEQERYEEAERQLEAVREDWASGDASIEAPRLVVRAKLMATQGWSKHAERAIDRAWRLARGTDWPCLQADVLVARADVLAVAGRVDDGPAVLREALRIATAKGYEAAASKASSRLAGLGAAAEAPERVSR